MTHIYLDANSTTPVNGQVRRTMADCLDQNYANPASQHLPGQIARRRIESARSDIAGLLGASRKDRLLFTSGGTEANNLALTGLTGGLVDSTTDATPGVIISSIEHPSVQGTADFLASRGFVVRKLPVDNSGQVVIEALRAMIDPSTRLVSLMLVNNETGVMQDVHGAAKICREHQVPLHCDAAQAVGKISVQFDLLGVSAMTFTAHKLHGPRGIGGLLIADGIEIHPIMFGGFQQLGQRPGTEDVALAAGFATAVEVATQDLANRTDYLRELRDLFEKTVCDSLPQAVINGLNSSRAPHTSNISFPGTEEFATVNRQALMMAADASGVAISTGSACASGSSERSPVLTAMGLPGDVVESSIRVSFSMESNVGDAVEGARRIINAVKRLRQQKSGRK